MAGHSGNKWNDYVDELAARGRQGDRGSNAAEWADDTIPTDTPDEESNAEGSDSSTIGHGATGSAQDSERNDDSDANCGPATPTATAPASPVSQPPTSASPATDPEAAPVASLNPRRVPPESVRAVWSEYDARPRSDTEEAITPTKVDKGLGLGDRQNSIVTQCLLARQECGLSESREGASGGGGG